MKKLVVLLFVMLALLTPVLLGVFSGDLRRTVSGVINSITQAPQSTVQVAVPTQGLPDARQDGLRFSA